jgi:arginyl-tRNA synthetase
MLCAISEQEFSRIYERLDIRITNMGESFYNPFIPAMLDDLVSRGLITDDKGAKCIFVPKRKVPLMV